MPRRYRWTIATALLTCLVALPLVLLNEAIEWKRRQLLEVLRNRYADAIDHVERTAVKYHGVLDDDPGTDCPAWEELDRWQRAAVVYAVNVNRDAVNYYEQQRSRSPQWRRSDLLYVLWDDFDPDWDDDVHLSMVQWSDAPAPDWFRWFD